MWPIPAELTLLIAGCLRRSDLLAFSCISRYYRKLLLPVLFSTVLLNGTYKSKLKMKQGLKILTSSEQDLKDTIRSLTTETAEPDPRKNHEVCFKKRAYECNKHELFQFLRILNNLQSLSLDPEPTTAHRTFKISHIPALMEATKHAPLRRLSLSINVDSKPNRVITPGPTGLDTLSVRWITDMLPQEHKPGGAFDHFFALITPSLASLSHLVLSFDNWKKPVSNIFDLTMLKAAGETLRNFHLEVTTEAGSVLADNQFRLVAEVFPKLTKLTMLDCNAVWNDDTVDSLVLLPCLTHLVLSLDLEKTDDQLSYNHDMAWYRRCFYRRFHATEKIFAKCPQLERFSWKHEPIDDSCNYMYHNFVVVVTNQGQKEIKPVMQWWMCDDYKNEHGGNLPLPKDMVKENAFWENMGIK